MPSIDFTKVNPTKKLEMIESAKKYFATHYYARVPVTEIAKAMDISRGSFYLYFASKKECFEYIITDSIDYCFSVLNSYAKEGKDVFQCIMSLYQNFSSSPEGVVNYSLLSEFSFRPTPVYLKVLEYRKQKNENWKNAYNTLFDSVSRHQTALSGTKFDCLWELLEEQLKYALAQLAQSKDKAKLEYILQQKLEIIKEGIYEK